MVTMAYVIVIVMLMIKPIVRLFHKSQSLLQSLNSHYFFVSCLNITVYADRFQQYFLPLKKMTIGHVFQNDESST